MLEDAVVLRCTSAPGLLPDAPRRGRFATLGGGWEILSTTYQRHSKQQKRFHPLQKGWRRRDFVSSLIIPAEGWASLLLFSQPTL